MGSAGGGGVQVGAGHDRAEGEALGGEGLGAALAAVDHAGGTAEATMCSIE